MKIHTSISTYFIYVIVPLLLTASIPIIIYFLSKPTKELEFIEWGNNIIGPELYDLDDRFEYSIKFKEEQLENIISVSYTFEHRGNVAIKAEDITRPITVESTAPWRLLLIINEISKPDEFNVSWHKKNDYEMYMQPTLINPDDLLNFRIYLTNTDKNYNPIEEKIWEKGKGPKLQWSARIAGLHSLSVNNWEDVYPKITYTERTRINFYVIVYLMWAYPIITYLNMIYYKRKNKLDNIPNDFIFQGVVFPFFLLSILLIVSYFILSFLNIF